MRKVKVDQMIVIFLVFLQLDTIHGQLYPKGWIKNGECLDMNQGPLQVDISLFIS
jgi:hypothetical protein